MIINSMVWQAASEITVTGLVVCVEASTCPSRSKRTSNFLPSGSSGNSTTTQKGMLELMERTNMLIQFEFSDYVHGREQVIFPNHNISLNELTPHVQQNKFTMRIKHLVWWCLCSA